MLLQVWAIFMFVKLCFAPRSTPRKKRKTCRKNALGLSFRLCVMSLPKQLLRVAHRSRIIAKLTANLAIFKKRFKPTAAKAIPAKRSIVADQLLASCNLVDQLSIAPSVKDSLPSRHALITVTTYERVWSSPKWPTKLSLLKLQTVLRLLR